ncbi:MAG: 4Fe-4S binding protein [Candidatus Adiutrix sp.]|jgi:dissimilatory sulfite reductase (desulfoviridin) alpha/beta subunit|nr:4Fe-4S binding protein [Candidatus Adiutrix sp.]
MTSPLEMKKHGFIAQRQEGFFALRLKVTGGRLTGAQLAALSRLAETYGRDEVHLTSRQSMEIPFIRLEEAEAFLRELEAAGMSPANVGAGLRTITACPGADVCRRGLTAPQEMAVFLEENLEAHDLPHKFKVGLTGCHNNCLKADTNDVGLQGGLFPLWSRPDLCTFCGLCQRVCPAQAISVNDSELIFESSKCVQCGRCYNHCPQKCWNGRGGWHLTFGGLYGNDQQRGRRLWTTLQTDENSILSTINKALDYYRQNARKGERFGRALRRLGWESFEKFMKAS